MKWRLKSCIVEMGKREKERKKEKKRIKERKKIKERKERKETVTPLHICSMRA